ncbi:hypothetical protein [uncultured Parabacteroides sp.]|jgi:hypothetical protein|uniref:hypothetical protein n=1 Tax=uncultured Parabacteroides sp. TaxID=512312 RepID=UPI0025FBB481|nr:hypothetical protein [uncultured Parabacteroides sp.]
MMLKQCLLILMLMGVSHFRLYAQSWSKEDSVWLSGVMSGKDTIRINPEFQKAIDSGTFIHLEDEPGQRMLEAPTELPILKDFSEYLHADADTVRDSQLYRSMPPSVYRLYVIELDTCLPINKGAYTPPPTRLIDKKEIKVGKLPVAVAAGGRNLYDTDIVKDGQKRGTLTGSAKFYFSLDDMLKWVFSKKERNKRKNRKRDDTWRYYNSMP